MNISFGTNIVDNSVTKFSKQSCDIQNTFGIEFSWKNVPVPPNSFSCKISMTLLPAYTCIFSSPKQQNHAINFPTLYPCSSQCPRVGARQYKMQCTLYFVVQLVVLLFDGSSLFKRKKIVITCWILNHELLKGWWFWPFLFVSYCLLSPAQEWSFVCKKEFLCPLD